MAVRAFESSESPQRRLTVVESAPRRRQDVRRERHHWLLLGGLALGAPFVLAVLIIGVVR